MEENHPSGTERSSVSAFTPLTINKDFTFPEDGQTHTPGRTHSLKLSILLYCGFGVMFAWSSIG